LEEWAAALKDWKKNGKLGPKPGKPIKFEPVRSIEPEEVRRFPTIPESWRYLRLCEIAQVGSGMSVSKQRKLGLPVEVPYLRVANVQRGYLELDEIKTMKIERSQLASLALRPGDVLFNEGGDRDKLGRGWVWDGQVDPCITQNHVFRATPYVQLQHHSKWISYWGNAFGQLYFLREGKQTTNLASINRTVLSNFPVPVPPFDEQEFAIETFEQQVGAVSELDNEIEDSERRIEALRHAILKRAFAGALVPQSNSDEPAAILLQRIKAQHDVACAKEMTKSKALKKRKTAAA
jgi:type I restriction enzyme, S subunit